MGPLTLTISNLARSIDFYTRVIGLKLLIAPETDAPTGEATLGAGGTPLLRLIGLPNAHRQPSFSTGLYHVAILLPTREDLGRFLINLQHNQAAISRLGSADHLVSEAIYLNDPDGNGLEIYRDRPRSEWVWTGSQVKMDTLAADMEGIIASVPDPQAPFTGLPDGTTIGHVHLRVGDLGLAQAFYAQVLGFDVVSQFPGALFISAGGYHHHLGLNIWQSKGAAPAPQGSVGLREYTIVVPDAQALSALAARLVAAGHTLMDQQNTSFLTHDPWQNLIRFSLA
jgi:catechol 2,3-dioxygenase